MITPCVSEDDFRRMLADSAHGPVLLLKHSTSCPISAAARRAYVQFADTMPEVACREVLVIEQRPLSRQIAEETGVAHQSPQVILFVNGQPVWHASHWNITIEALRLAYSDAQKNVSIQSTD